MSDSDYQEIVCYTCGTVHWIPVSLWETCIMTKNDNYPVKAFCPYGHHYIATPDQRDETETPPPAPPVKKKKPWRFWTKEEKLQDDNIIKFEGKRK